MTALEALHALDGGYLLTSREAAHYLGLRSVNTLKAVLSRHGIPYRRISNRMTPSHVDLERLTSPTSTPPTHPTRAATQGLGGVEARYAI